MLATSERHVVAGDFAHTRPNDSAEAGLEKRLWLNHYRGRYQTYLLGES
jgi:hypothetical protein